MTAIPTAAMVSVSSADLTVQSSAFAPSAVQAREVGSGSGGAAPAAFGPPVAGYSLGSPGSMPAADSA